MKSNWKWRYSSNFLLDRVSKTKPSFTSSLNTNKSDFIILVIYWSWWMKSLNRNVKPHLPLLYVDEFAQQFADVSRERAANAPHRFLEAVGPFHAPVSMCRKHSVKRKIWPEKLKTLFVFLKLSWMGIVATLIEKESRSKAELWRHDLKYGIEWYG